MAVMIDNPTKWMARGFRKPFTAIVIIDQPICANLITANQIAAMI